MAHTHILGSSGSGKSTLLKQLILEDIQAGHAVVFFDPHGPDTDVLLEHYPIKRIRDVVLFDPTHDPLIKWNPLEDDSNIPLIATALSDAMRVAWRYDKIATPVLEMMVQAFVSYALYQQKTLLDVFFLLDNVSDIQMTSNEVLDHFMYKYQKKIEKDRDALNASTYNKLFTLLIDERMQRLFGRRNGRLHIKDVVKDKVLFVRLPQGQLGLGKTRLIGSLLLAQLHIACLSRDPNVPLSIYIDEAHSFAAPTIIEMLSGVRKYNVSLTIAHQNVDQLDEALFASLRSNCDTRHIFRTSPEDGELFQLCTKNGPTCLKDLPLHTYRTFPWYTSDRDTTTVPLPVPKQHKSKLVSDCVKLFVEKEYC